MSPNLLTPTNDVTATAGKIGEAIGLQVTMPDNDVLPVLKAIYAARPGGLEVFNAAYLQVMLAALEEFPVVELDKLAASPIGRRFLDCATRVTT